MNHGLASTYKNHGCRCPACREAARAYQATQRAKGHTPFDNINKRAQVLALRWIKNQMPDVWQGFLDEAASELGVVRRPVGRPLKESS